MEDAFPCYFSCPFLLRFFSLGQFTPCQACLLGSFWRRRKVQPWKKYTRAPCKIACTGKVYHENEHPQEKCVHHENLAFLRHRRQFSPLPSLFLEDRELHSVTDLHFESNFNSQTQYKFWSLNIWFPKVVLAT